MAAPSQPPRGLSAAELAAACAELQSLRGATVVDVVRVPRTAADDDLVLVLGDGPLPRKVLLHVVATGPTARVCPTARRWRKGTMQPATGFPLAGATLTAVRVVDGQRVLVLRFDTSDGPRQLVAELFGPRGLFVLADGADRVLHTSRPVATATRRLAVHDVYAPPARTPSPAGPGAAESPPRFAPPVLAAIDAHFTRIDVLADAQQRVERQLVAARRAAAKARAKVDGIERQLADVGRADGLRSTANLMLAYQHTVPRGAPSMRVPDPDRADAELTIELDPARPVVVQAQALYEKARRLDDSRATSAARLAGARAELATAERALAAAEQLAAAVAALAPDAPDLTDRIAALPFPAEPPPRAPRSERRPGTRAHGDATRGENVRRFVSAEGYPIWVGRDNEQNDRLTMRLANGNDLWLHVGGGRAGSHVVVRLPKGKTASLETLLDAGTLAVHFSKARGEPRIDVVYTHRKHVRKPKGLPPGAVVPSHTKTITVLRDETRLQRLLDASGGEPERD
jgi:predicted ribosome quality control (RQC) complex YloA/Tae2 family protein